MLKSEPPFNPGRVGPSNSRSSSHTRTGGKSIRSRSAVRALTSWLYSYMFGSTITLATPSMLTSPSSIRRSTGTAAPNEPSPRTECMSKRQIPSRPGPINRCTVFAIRGNAHPYDERQCSNAGGVARYVSVERVSWEATCSPARKPTTIEQRVSSPSLTWRSTPKGLRDAARSSEVSMKADRRCA